MLLILFFIPIMMIVWGLRWRKNPPAYPKNPDVPGWNFFISYRTEWSTKSVETWRYSHISYGRMILPLGILAMVATILGLFLLPLEWAPQAVLILDLVFIMIPYFPIEKKMKVLFDRKGNWKEN